MGWRLAQNPNVRVSVVCRSNYEEVNTRGYQLITSKWGPASFKPYRTYRSCAEIPPGRFDNVLCTNKVTPTLGNAYSDLRRVVSEQTTLVSLQNGIGVEAALRQVFPENTLISGIVYVSCQQPRSGLIQQTACIRSHIAGLALSPPRHRAISSMDRLRFNDFVHLGNGEYKPISDLVSERWTKQLWNGSFNPLCAIFGLSTHELLAGANGKRGLVADLMRETRDVAVAAGARLSQTISDDLINVTVNSPSIEPSMLHDVRLRRNMEIESINGMSSSVLPPLFSPKTGMKRKHAR